MSGAGERAARLLAVLYRGPVAQSEHYGHVAVVADGPPPLRLGLGDPEKPVVLRSCAKPLQALSVVVSGAARQFGLEPRHLAVCCASHSGSAAHQAVVREILERMGLGEDALQCGAHWPGDAEEFDRLKRAGLRPTAIHNNCSGKHAGMLATSLALGAPLEGYLAPEHPTQALIREHLARMGGVGAVTLRPLVDGCGAPTYAVPLRAVATAFGRLAQPEDLPAELQEAARSTGAAMTAYPELVSSVGSFTAELMRAWPGRILAKGGAEGLFAVGLSSGVGVAIKVSDGAERPSPVLVLAVLGKGGAEAPPALAEFARAEERNCRGELVGHLAADPALEGLLPAVLRQLEANS